MTPANSITAQLNHEIPILVCIFCHFPASPRLFNPICFFYYSIDRTNITNIANLVISFIPNNGFPNLFYNITFFIVYTKPFSSPSLAVTVPNPQPHPTCVGSPSFHLRIATQSDHCVNRFR